MYKDMIAEVVKMALDAGLTDFRMTDGQEQYGSHCAFVRFDDGRPPSQIGIDVHNKAYESREAELETYRAAIAVLARHRAPKGSAAEAFENMKAKFDSMAKAETQ